MLTGDNPFFAKDPTTVMRNILYEDVSPPSLIDVNVPKELDRIVIKELEKQKENLEI